jgi:hypothetical protein
VQFGDLGGLCGVEKFTDPRHESDGNLVQSAGNGGRSAPMASSSLRLGCFREYLK